MTELRESDWKKFKGCCQCGVNVTLRKAFPGKAVTTLADTHDHTIPATDGHSTGTLHVKKTAGAVSARSSAC